MARISRSVKKGVCPLPYEWDVRDRLTAVEERDGSDDLEKRTAYEYCVTCGGSMTDRIEYNGSLVLQSWLRYEYEGLNLLRIDELYDGDDHLTGESDPGTGFGPERRRGGGRVGSVSVSETVAQGGVSPESGAFSLHF